MGLQGHSLENTYTHTRTLFERFWAQWKKWWFLFIKFFENRSWSYPTQFSTLYRMTLFPSFYDVVEKSFVRNIKKLSLVTALTYLLIIIIMMYRSIIARWQKRGTYGSQCKALIRILSSLRVLVIWILWFMLLLFFLKWNRLSNNTLVAPKGLSVTAAHCTHICIYNNNNNNV